MKWALVNRVHPCITRELGGILLDHRMRGVVGGGGGELSGNNVFKIHKSGRRWRVSRRWG
jgi:hypothetical protein